MAIIKIFIFIVAFFIFNSCSNTQLEKIETIRTLYLKGKEELEFKFISKEELEKINYPIIEIRTNDILKQVLFLRITKRDDFENYISGTGQSFTKNGFLLIRTNGFHAYLLSVEQDPSSPLMKQTELSKWPEMLKRKYTFLLSDHSSETIEFSCFINIKNEEKVSIHEKILNLVHVHEQCVSDKIQFSNIYWAEDNGFIWKSNQWISLSNQTADIYILKK